MSNNDSIGNGVQFDLISASRMSGMGTAEKINMIIDGVRENKIVILESGLSPDEESKLIERTMNAIEPDEFSGIEIESYQSGESSKSGVFGRMGKMLQRDDDSDNNLTIIGPADRLETLHKDDSLISAMARTE